MDKWTQHLSTGAVSKQQQDAHLFIKTYADWKVFVVDYSFESLSSRQPTCIFFFIVLYYI